MINKILILIMLSINIQVSYSQLLMELSLNEAYSLLEAQYPLLKNETILDQIYEKELQQLDIAKNPTIDWKADGRFQTQSTNLETGDAPIPFEINQPLVNIKTYAEANYTLLDGGINEAQRKVKSAQLIAKKQNLEVEKFALRKRINGFFVQVIVLREQLKIFDISLQDLAERKKQIRAGIEEGIVLPSEITKIEVKELEIKAQQDNLNFRIKGMIHSLAQLIGKTIDEQVQLSLPILPELETIPAINRPEQALFKSQREAILAQSDRIEASKKPKLGAYAQAGIGYPNPLNILDNNLAPFGIVGARFSMPITDWQKSKVDREILSLQAQQLNNVEAALVFNLDSQQSSYLMEVKRIQSHIQNQEQIAQLQKEILELLAIQLDEGIITSTIYLTQVNTELKVRQNLAIHRSELIKLQLEFLNTRGTWN